MGLETYLSGLWQAIQGNSQQPVPQQPQGGAQPPAAAPQGGGLTGLLSNPLTQAALSGYFSAAGSPRLAGRGGRISAGGLGALQGFNTAEAAQQQGPMNAAKLQGLQTQNQLTGAQAALAQGKASQLAGVAEANAALAAQINLAKPTMTPIQAQRATIVANTIAADTSKPHTLAEAFTQIYQEPLKESQIQAQTGASTAAAKKSEAETGAIPSEIALRQAETGRAGAEAANAGAAKGIADWYDPTTKQYYRGAQKKPTDVPASVAGRDVDLKTRGAWQKEYDNAKAKYITEHTATGFFGSKTPPTEADVDAYARSQADAIYGPLSSIGASSGSADEPSTAADDPLSLIPEGGTPAMKGDVHGYTTPDGAFHAVE